MWGARGGTQVTIPLSCFLEREGGKGGDSSNVGRINAHVVLFGQKIVCSGMFSSNYCSAGDRAVYKLVK
jgi:hypothetical protein